MKHWEICQPFSAFICEASQCKCLDDGSPHIQLVSETIYTPAEWSAHTTKIIGVNLNEYVCEYNQNQDIA